MSALHGAFLLLLFCMGWCGGAAGRSAAAGIAVTYADVRGRVAKALPEKANELADALAVMQQLSSDSALALKTMQSRCGSM